MSTVRPVIGVSCYVEDIDRDPWVAQHSIVLPARYTDQLTRAGAIALVLPPQDGDDDDTAREALSRVDGLVIAGGADIEASRYAASPHPTAQAPRRDRDAWEIALTRAAIDADLPLFGICRGMQVMAVAAGAGLVQHLPEVVGTDVHCPRPGEYTEHPVTITQDTALAGILGAGDLDVPTYHHQSVDPESLRHTAYRPTAWHADGTLEAMEDPEGAYRIAVQWHPEVGADPRLFDALVAACRS